MHRNAEKEYHGSTLNVKLYPIIPNQVFSVILDWYPLVTNPEVRNCYIEHNSLSELVKNEEKKNLQ